MNEPIGLRLEQSSRPGPAPPRESSVLAASGRGPRGGRVLIMDDDALVREVMRRQLVVCGFEVVAAVEGSETVTAYAQAREEGRPFDAVILDLLVENGWGGEQTLEELRRIDPAVKALVCSGTISGPPAEYLRLGFCGILKKPYAIGELRDTVEALLQRGL